MKRAPIESESLKQALQDSLARNGEPPKRWGEFLPRWKRRNQPPAALSATAPEPDPSDESSPSNP
jgi:hypothetical protein